MPLLRLRLRVVRHTIALALCALLLAAATVAGPARAQQDLFRPAAVVNDDIISVLDLAMRLQLAIIAAGVEDSQDIRKRLTPQVLDSLIDERLQMQEARRLDISVTDVQVAGALEQIAQQNNMTEGQFLTMLRNRGVIPTTLIDQIRAQPAWQAVVLRRGRARVVQPTAGPIESSTRFQVHATGYAGCTCPDRRTAGTSYADLMPETGVSRPRYQGLAAARSPWRRIST